MAIKLSGVGNNYGLRLYRDKYFSSAIELTEIQSALNTRVVELATLTGFQVDIVYNWDGNVLTQRIDFRVSGNKLLFDNPFVGTLLIIPKSELSLIQLSSLGVASQVYIKTFPSFTYREFTVSSLDLVTGLAGPFEFAETSVGPFLTTLVLDNVPESFWIRSKATTVGKMASSSLVVTSKLYL